MIGASDASGAAAVSARPLTVVPGKRPGFSMVPGEQSGILFTNVLSNAGASQNQIRANGSGVAAGDVDGDGWCDLYFCRMEGGNVLYRNLGNWKFEDVTAGAGVACAGQNSSGAVFADVDGDGDLDLLVSGLGVGARLFLNDGKGKFTEASDSGIERKFGATSLALADVDGDGDLDLYVVNNRTTTIRDTGLQIMVVKGQRMIKPEDRDHVEFTPQGTILEYGEADCFYLNDGKGHFTKVSWTGGAFLDEKGEALKEPPRDWGFAAQFRDMNQDGWPDLYVCNDFFSPDRIWINRGKGVFQAIAPNALTKTSLASMAIDFADINRDGFDDFIVGDLLSRDHRLVMSQHEPNGQSPDEIDKLGGRPQVENTTLFLNRGDNTYAEIGHLAGLEATEWTWGLAFVDVDLDGFEDLLVTNGHGFNALDTDTVMQLDHGPRIPRNERFTKFPRLARPNLAFRNGRDLTFADASLEWGFDAVAVSNGMALADLDNDGDLDVIVNNLNERALVYRNRASGSRVAIRLKGRSPNTAGVGARISVSAIGLPMQSQEMICGGRYLSSDDAMRVFAAGSGSVSVKVKWPGGNVSTATNLAGNTAYEISEEGSVSEMPAASQKVVPLFEDASAKLNLVHAAAPFDDFARQPLLPYRPSHFAPGVAWFDVDADGFDDLLIDSGTNGLAQFHNNHGKDFLPGKAKSLAVNGPAVGFEQNGVSSFFVAANGTSNSVLTRLNSNGEVLQQFSAANEIIGALALADIDGDGDLDLFAGARMIPGRYPEAPVSYFYKNEGATFRMFSIEEISMAVTGMISGALFCDLNDDGSPDLLLAQEWGPVRVLINSHGAFRDETEARGLAKLTGWWTGLALGDFDGDGRIDFVAGNWGRNTKYNRFTAKPLRLYHGDLNGTGGVDLVEAFFDAEMKKYVPWQDLETCATAIQYVSTRFSSFRKYGESSVEEIFGDKLQSCGVLEANTLETTVFLDRGDHFEPRALPVEGQFAPVFGLAVADFDGDGNQDIVAAQNFFGVRSESPKYDAGRGLLLLGDGKGNFRAANAGESGIELYGEQRGVAVADYDHDGRPDIAITQHNGAAKLFHNTRGIPGIRVQLQGSANNPSGIGALVRPITARGRDPAFTIHAGSGFLSQDSSTITLSSADRPTKIAVRWPGGKTTESSLPTDAKAVIIDRDGTITASIP